MTFVATESKPSSAPTKEPFAHRRWCLWAGGVLLLLGFVSNTIYLFNHCPLDLSEDEAHYWEWSRHLAMGYYSKGPGIAWIIAAATAVGRWFGQTHATMPVVRMPAVLFSTISGLAGFLLARRIFRDDRAALMTLVLCAAVPMFALGSLFITIDSPMYAAWALATLFLWYAVEPAGWVDAPAGDDGPSGSAPQTATPGARAFWLYAAGLFTGLGMLCKPILIALPPCAAIAALANPDIRKHLKTWHSLGAALLALALQIPPILWNARHHWVMIWHIGGEGGFEGRVDLVARLANAPLGLLNYIGTQAGGMGGILFVLLALAVWQAFKKCRANGANETSGLAFLLSMTVPLWLFYMLLSLWTKVEVNWPAASYFAGMVLLGGILTEVWNQADARGRRWSRRWTIVAVAWGFLLVVAAENYQRVFYPLMRRVDPEGLKYKAHKWDPAFRVRGLRQRATVIQSVRRAMPKQNGKPPLVIAGRYDTASSLAFYLPGQPFVYCIMSQTGGRESQYDFWPGLNQKGRDGRLRFFGRDAVLTGAFGQKAFDDVIRPAFKRVSPMEKLPVRYHGVVIRRLNVWKCYGFKGLPAGLKPKMKY